MTKNEHDLLVDLEHLQNRIKELEANNYEQNNIINNYIEERKDVIKALEDRIQTTTNRPDYNWVGTEWEEELVVDDWKEILSILKGETEDDK